MIHPKYITDSAGKKLSVILAIREYKSILKELEELEDIRLYDDAKGDKRPSVPIDEAFKMIEAKRHSRKNK